MPKAIGRNLDYTAWVETGKCICSLSFMEHFDRSFPNIGPDLWIESPTASSDVGGKMPVNLKAAGRGMYHLNRSLLAYVGTTSSRMNATYRNRTKYFMATRLFADGDEVY